LEADRTTLQQLPQLRGHLLDQVRSAVELGRGVLIQRDPPLPITPDGDERLHPVDGGSVVATD
jgi:hypothetical protein